MNLVIKNSCNFIIGLIKCQKILARNLHRIGQLSNN